MAVTWATEHRASRVAAIAAAGVALIGVLGIATRVTGAQFLPAWPSQSSPLAFWVALATLLLGAGLFALVLRPDNIAVRRAVIAGGVIVLAASLVTLVAHLSGSTFDIERFSRFQQLSKSPLTEGRSTGPLGAPVLGLGAAALLMLASGRSRSAVGALALVLLVTGIFTCIGFLYPAPIFQIPTWRPVSPSAAFGVVLLAIGLISAAGLTAWPLRAVVGRSVQSQLIRWFLPFTVLIVLFTDLLTVNLFAEFSPAFGSTINTLVSVVGVAIVTYFAARIIGGRIERAEQQLADSETQFRSLIENSSDLITITDETGTIRYRSPSARSLLGYDQHERLGGNIADLVHPEDMGRIEEAIARTLRPGGEPHAVMCRLRHKSGTWRMVESVATNMLSVGGVAGVVIRSRDVTDRYALEEQLRQSQKMETVGQLAGGIAHDFNNMLSVIMANTELVATTLPPDSREAQEELRDVRGAAEQGKSMVRQLMSFSRVSGLEVRPTDLGSLAERVAGMLRRMMPAGVKIDIDTRPHPPLVMADPGAVEQMVLNLANNARDAMHGGGRMVISARRAGRDDLPTADATPEGYVCLVVSDTGTGMDDATLQKVFEPFFTTKPAGTGTGLGMAMVHGLMIQHGGHVHVTSQLGEGTIVRLCFPNAPVVATTQIQEAERFDPLALRGTETVLVVEDEEALRRVAQRILEKQGYTVLTAEDGDAALKVLAAPGCKVDLIFTDMVMPKTGGVDLYHRVTSEVGPRRFLVASGYGALEVKGGLGLPATIPFIKKPWSLSEMLVAVREAIEAPT